MILKTVVALSLSAALAASLSVMVFLSSSAFASAPQANGYLLSMRLSLNGKPVSSPRIAVKEGESASISEDGTFIEVVASEKLAPSDATQKSSILMKFVIGTVNAQGEKKILSSPQIIARENEKAEITVGGDSTHDDVSLSVIASRKRF